MNSTDTKEIAKTILAQIGHRNIMCFGVPPRSITALPETEENAGGLSFRFTNCPKIRSGTVRVDLKWNDTYTVRIFSANGMKETHTESDIHCEELFPYLDHIIG